MHGLITTLIAQSASCTSILGLYFTLYPPGTERPWWHWLLVLISIGTTSFVFWREIVNYVRAGPKTYRSTEKINAYMRRWVAGGGRVVIFSRDLSWAND